MRNWLSSFVSRRTRPFLRNAEIQVEAMNHALANVPADRVRIW